MAEPSGIHLRDVDLVSATMSVGKYNGTGDTFIDIDSTEGGAVIVLDKTSVISLINYLKALINLE